MLNVVAHAVFLLGCYLSLTNFYLSFVRYPIFRVRGGNADDYRWISAVPLLGSLLIVAALPFIDTNIWLWWFGVVCAILDTGGLHWFVCVMAYMTVTGRIHGDR